MFGSWSSTRSPGRPTCSCAWPSSGTRTTGNTSRWNATSHVATWKRSPDDRPGARHAQGPPHRDYYESFTELGKMGILEPVFASKIASSACLGDRIGHERDSNY